MRIVDIFGMPGCGKSTISHEVARQLRNEGYKVLEPSWDLDQKDAAFIRKIKKLFFGIFYAMGYPKENKKLRGIIKKVQNEETSSKKMWVNFAYTLYVMKKKAKADFLIMDEGLAQAIVSLYMFSDIKDAKEYMDELLNFQGKEVTYIHCSVSPECSMKRMAERTNGCSRVERLEPLKQKEILEHIHKMCEALMDKTNACMLNNEQSKEESIGQMFEFIKGINKDSL